MKCVIHVNQHIIRANKKHDGYAEPPLTVKSYKGNLKASHVDIIDDNDEIVASVVYSPDHPLSCGAHVWVETRMKVKVS